MLLKSLHSGKLLAYLTLSVTDLCLTYSLLQRNEGVVYESNPIANAWLSTYGWTGLAGFKIAAMILVSLLACYISVYRPIAANRILSFACCAVAFVVVYSCWLMNEVATFPVLVADAQSNQLTPVAFQSKESSAETNAALRQRPRIVRPSTQPAALTDNRVNNAIKVLPVSFRPRIP